MQSYFIKSISYKNDRKNSSKMEEATTLAYLSNMTNDSALATPSKLVQTLTLINTVCNTAFLVLILLAIGCSSSFTDIWNNLRRPVGIVVACCVEFILMPFVGYGFPRILKLSSPYAFSAFLLTCCPGGSASNLFSFLADGCLPLSICMTSFSTLLSVGTLPLHMLIYGLLTTGGTATTAIPIENIAVTLATIIIPAFSGILIKSRFEKAAKIISKICGPTSLIIVLLGLSIRLYLDVNLYLKSPWEVFVITGLIPPIGFTLGFVISSICRQPYYKRRTIGIETGGQNIALALSVISLSFSPGIERQQMQVIPTIQAFVGMTEYFVAIGIFRLCRKYGPCKKQGDTEKLITEGNDALENGILNPDSEVGEDVKKMDQRENGGCDNVKADYAMENGNSFSYMLALENRKFNNFQPPMLQDAATQTEKQKDDDESNIHREKNDVEETVIDEILASHNLDETIPVDTSFEKETIFDEEEYAQMDNGIIIDEIMVNSEGLKSDSLETYKEMEESRL